jgi:two-component system, sporulation sensor kinase E
VPVDPSDRSKIVLESLDEGIIAFDVDRSVVVANPCALRLLGRTEDASGVAAQVVFENIPELHDLVGQGFSKGAYVRQVDVVIRPGNSDSHHLRVSTSSIDFDSQTGLLLVIRDVSDSKRSDRGIYHADKMTALGRLAASVAHEVRNPLGAVNLQLQLLEEDAFEMPESDRIRLLRRLNIANAEIKRLDRIVGNFLRFSRAPKVKFESLSLNEVVRRVFDLVTPEAREQNVNLVLDLTDGLPAVDGDEGQLAQAVLNITVNAFHAIQEQDKAPDEGIVRANTRLEPDGSIRLAIQDDGGGISEIDLDRVFEFYYTTKDEGTGLGLSIAQRIVYEHGGRIDVASESGDGTTFMIYLPAAGSGEPLRG